MQKFGKIGWLVFEIVTFFKIPNNVFYFEIGRAPTPPKRILLWIDARPPRKDYQRIEKTILKKSEQKVRKKQKINIKMPHVNEKNH